MTDMDLGWVQPANPSPINLILTLGRFELCMNLNSTLGLGAKPVTLPCRHPAPLPLGQLCQRTGHTRAVPVRELPEQQGWWGNRRAGSSSLSPSFPPTSFLFFFSVSALLFFFSPFLFFFFPLSLPLLPLILYQRNAGPFFFFFFHSGK